MSCPLPDAPPDASLEDASSGPIDPALEQAAWAAGILRRLAELSMEMAEILLERARTQAPAAEGAAPIVQGDPGLALTRVARSVRQTVSLHARLTEDLAGRRKAAAAEAGQAAAKVRADAEERAREAYDSRRQTRAYEIEASVAQAIEIHTDDPVEVARLNEDLKDRLEACELDEGGPTDLCARPLGETIARLCHQLGLDPDWSRWDGEAWVVKRPCAPPPWSPPYPVPAVLSAYDQELADGPILLGTGPP
jgi:hypothetical protein